MICNTELNTNIITVIIMIIGYIIFRFIEFTIINSRKEA